MDGKDVDTKKIPLTIPFLMTLDETFDVGVDTRTPVRRSRPGDAGGAGWRERPRMAAVGRTGSCKSRGNCGPPQ